MNEWDPETNPFEVLGLNAGASPDEIRKVSDSFYSTERSKMNLVLQ